MNSNFYNNGIFPYCPTYPIITQPISYPQPYTSTTTEQQILQPTIESIFARYTPCIFNGTKHLIKFFRFIDDDNNIQLLPDNAVYYDRGKEAYCIRQDINIRCIVTKEIKVNQTLTCITSGSTICYSDNGTLPILKYSANCTSVKDWKNYDIIIGSEYWVDTITKMPEYSLMDFKDRLYVPIPLFQNLNDAKPFGTYTLKKKFEYSPKDYFSMGVLNDSSVHISLFNITECVRRFRANGAFDVYTNQLEKVCIEGFKQSSKPQIKLT